MWAIGPPRTSRRRPCFACGGPFAGLGDGPTGPVGAAGRVQPREVEMAQVPHRTPRTSQRGIADGEAGGDLTDALAVRAAVTALPARQRAAVVLRYFNDLSV